MEAREEMTRKPALVDRRAADLAKIDVEIERLSKQLAGKKSAIDADKRLHALDQNADLQKRLGAEANKIGELIENLRDKRFKAEIGEAAEIPAPKPSTPPTEPTQRRAWDLQPAQEPEYPAVARTAANHKTFSDAFDRLSAFCVYRRALALKAAGCHPDDRVPLDLAAAIAAQSQASFIWLAHRCQAMETRLAEIENRPAAEHRANTKPLQRSVTKVLKHDATGRIAEFEKVDGEAEQIDVWQRLEQVEKQLSQVQGGGIRYAGVWSQDKKYTPGEFVTHGGAMWAAKVQSTGVKPGEGGLCWQLAVKAGRDAR
ncbi:hypothetical protein [Mesorhizobium sp. dw_380]|uniref:hypothetical protein n=1 Tax=Mesorhizobium sp. dw_380 TaxID=2812001 RepID=UPI001BDE999C|nr:hypothetical protein [Mesorhizobium sp. dw_380]